MEREKWIKWEPTKDIPQTVYCESIEYNSDGLSIKLQGQSTDAPIFTVNFEFFLALRVMDEGNFLKDSCDIDEAVLSMKLEPGSFSKWSLFTVENSPFKADMNLVKKYAAEIFEEDWETWICNEQDKWLIENHHDGEICFGKCKTANEKK